MDGTKKLGHVSSCSRSDPVVIETFCQRDIDNRHRERINMISYSSGSLESGIIEQVHGIDIPNRQTTLSVEQQASFAYVIGYTNCAWEEFARSDNHVSRTSRLHNYEPTAVFHSPSLSIPSRLSRPTKLFAALQHGPGSRERPRTRLGQRQQEVTFSPPRST